MEMELLLHNSISATTKPYLEATPIISTLSTKMEASITMQQTASPYPLKISKPRFLSIKSLPTITK